jgi:hypothetical protein
MIKLHKVVKKNSNEINVPLFSTLFSKLDAGVHHIQCPTKVL